MHTTTSSTPVASWAAALCLAAAAVASHAEPAADRAAREAAAKAKAKEIREAAAADYKAARVRCDTKAGNDKDVCIKVAKAFRDDAEARALQALHAAR